MVRRQLLEEAHGTKTATDMRMSDKPYDLRDRSFLYACDIVAFSRRVAERDYILRRLAYQLVDAGGSVGANLEEAVDGQTKPDFISKQFISLKEARETRFWLRLIAASEPPLKPAAQPLIQESSELIAILRSSVKTAKSNPYRGDREK
jgi:four helix bundle protein